MSLTHFTPYSRVYTVNFEQVIANWVSGKLLICQSKTNNRALKKSRNIHRKTYALESFFNTVAGFKTCNLIKKRLLHRRFPVSIVKFLRTAFAWNTSDGSFQICNFGRKDRILLRNEEAS